MRNGGRKRKGRDHVLNPEVEGLTADGQDQEAGRDQEVEEDPRDLHKILAYLELAKVSQESSFVKHAKQLASQIDRDTHNFIIAKAFLEQKEVALAFDLVKNSPVDCARLFVI